ncbi:MAG: hypothetical protein MZU95_03050 [Desulfomicrobium escambiense]|nr:hypothetical protein [Desulfomicrobium escambiense]
MADLIGFQHALALGDFNRPFCNQIFTAAVILHLDRLNVDRQILIMS